MRIIIFLLTLSLTSYLNCQKTIEIIKSGQGPSEKEAINSALRSCIESTFGVFVSSSTKIKNDELLYDQISTVANGYINDYKILSSKKNNTLYDVIVSANISPKKLVVQLNKNGQNKFEIKGAVYTQNIKKERFYKEQEYNVFRDFLKMYENQDFSQVEIKKIYKPKIAERDIIKQTISNSSNIKKSHFGENDWVGGSFDNPNFKSFLINNPKTNNCGSIASKYLTSLNCDNVSRKRICIHYDMIRNHNKSEFRYFFKNNGFARPSSKLFQDEHFYSIPIYLTIEENKNLIEFEKQLKNLYQKVKIKNLYEYENLMGEADYFWKKNISHLFKYDVLGERIAWYFRNNLTKNLIIDFYKKHVVPCFNIRNSLCGDHNKYYYIASQMVYNSKIQNHYSGFLGESISFNFQEFAIGKLRKRKKIKIPVAINIFLSENELSNLQELEFNHVNPNRDYSKNIDNTSYGDAPGDIESTEESVSVIDEKQEIKFPSNLFAINVFNPNSSDSRFNRFIPHALTQRRVSFKMIILDPRDGGTVYETTETSMPWNGIDRRNGYEAEAKSYVWRVELINPNPGEAKVYQGTIRLIR